LVPLEGRDVSVQGQVAFDEYLAGMQEIVDLFADKVEYMHEHISDPARSTFSYDVWWLYKGLRGFFLTLREILEEMHEYPAGSFESACYGELKKRFSEYDIEEQGWFQEYESEQSRGIAELFLRFLAQQAAWRGPVSYVEFVSFAWKRPKSMQGELFGMVRLIEEDRETTGSSKA
jgi:hypothetical protein